MNTEEETSQDIQESQSQDNIILPSAMIIAEVYPDASTQVDFRCDSTASIPLLALLLAKITKSPYLMQELFKIAATSGNEDYRKLLNIMKLAIGDLDEKPAMLPNSVFSEDK